MLEHINSILLYSFYIISGVQGIFMLIIFPRVLFFGRNKKNENTTNEAVSIVIAAKDEYYNLSDFLPKVLDQDYPNFEVIVVNNGSDDDSEFLLKNMENDYPNFKYINVHSDANFFAGKKFPLSIGIKSAKNDLLLLTDADCYPASKNWIREIVESYDNKTEIVLGYGAYEEKRGLLNKLLRFDTLRVALLYFSFAAWKMPYMGVGRNLSYRKSLFYKNNGFVKHYKTISGDDDLFINQTANRKNTSININADAKTISRPKESFGEWFKQKRRHLTTGKFYKKWHLIILGLYETSTLLFYIFAVILLILKINLLILLYIFLGRTIITLILIKKFTNILNERKLLLLSPLLEFIIVLMGTLVNMSNLLYKQRKWK